MNVRVSNEGIAVLAILALAWITGCASTSQQAPIVTKDTSVQLELPSTGKIVVREPLPKGYSCAEIDRVYSIRVRTQGNRRKNLPMVRDCMDRGRHITYATRSWQPKGTYTVSFFRRFSKTATRPSQVWVRFKNADFASGEDAYLEGATAAAPGKAVSGEVNYSQGNQTNWIRLEGSGLSTRLTLIAKPGAGSKDTAISSALYAVGPSGAARRIRFLKPGKPTKVQISSQPVYVKVRADTFSKGTKYTLLRRDQKQSRSLRLTVIDCYPVGGQESIVLMQPREGIDAQVRIEVQARTASGKTISMGACKVVQADEGSLSCRVLSKPPESAVAFSAKGYPAG
jgi:hypothetical protein